MVSACTLTQSPFSDVVNMHSSRGDVHNSGSDDIRQRFQLGFRLFVDENPQHNREFGWMLVPTSPPLLVADQASLRSRHRQRLTGTYRWKARRAVVSRQSDEELLLQLYPITTASTTEPSLQLIIDTTVHTSIDADHDTHIIVVGSFESKYEGSDLPKDHDNTSRRPALSADSRSWRLRFSSKEEALFWKDTLQVRNPPHSEGTTANPTSVPALLSRPLVVFFSVAISMFGIVLSILATMLGILLWLLFRMFHDLILVSDHTHEDVVSTKQPPPLTNTKYLSETFANLAILASDTLDSLLSPTPGIEIEHVTVRTPFRNLLEWRRTSFDEAGAFPPGSFANDYWIVCATAFLVFAISALSLVSRFIPHRVMVGVTLTVVAGLLAHDTFANDWYPPLIYGRYWNFYLQAGVAAVCFSLAIVQIRKALGWTPVAQISPRRKVASALAAALVSSSFPLTMRAFANASSPLPEGIFLGLAVCNFFVGLHFFGWARRQLVVGNIPIGELLYQTSRIPANATRYLLVLVSVLLRLAWDAAFLLLCATRDCRVTALHFINLSVLQPGIDLLRGPVWQHVRLLVVASTRAAVRARKVARKCTKRLFEAWGILTSSGQRLFFDCVGCLRQSFLRICNAAQPFLKVALKLSERLGQELSWFWCISQAQLRWVLDNIVLPPLTAGAKAIGSATKTLTQSAVAVARWAIENTRSVLGIVCRVLELSINATRSWALYVATMLGGFAPIVLRLVTTVNSLVYAALSNFFKKYWRLVFAGLSLNGSYVFAMSALSEGFISDRVKFLLGSWSLLLVGITVADSVIASRGSLALQRVVVAESPIRHIDMHVTQNLIVVLTSGWYALSAVFDLALAAVDFVIRKTSTVAWKLSQSLYGLTARPIVLFVGRLALIIWNSPVYSMVASVGSVFLAHSIHQSRSSLLSIVSTIKDNLTCSICPWNFWSSSLLRETAIIPTTVKAMLDIVLDPIAQAHMWSPTAALSCWLLTFGLAKTQRQPRVKAFALPLVLLYSTGVAHRYFATSCWVLLVWFCLSVVFDDYERRTHERTTKALEELHHESPTIHMSTDECVICLGTKCDAQVCLPCGHTFHKQCFTDWVQSSGFGRCPLCRRATGGFDRALEVVF